MSHAPTNSKWYSHDYMHHFICTTKLPNIGTVFGVTVLCHKYLHCLQTVSMTVQESLFFFSIAYWEEVGLFVSIAHPRSRKKGVCPCQASILNKCQDQCMVVGMLTAKLCTIENCKEICKGSDLMGGTTVNMQKSPDKVHAQVEQPETELQELKASEEIDVLCSQSLGTMNMSVH